MDETKTALDDAKKNNDELRTAMNRVGSGDKEKKEEKMEENKEEIRTFP